MHRLCTYLQHFFTELLVARVYKSIYKRSLDFEGLEVWVDESGGGGGVGIRLVGVGG